MKFFILHFLDPVPSESFSLALATQSKTLKIHLKTNIDAERENKSLKSYPEKWNPKLILMVSAQPLECMCFLTKNIWL